MNRFRTKKKGKDGGDISGNRSESPAVPALKSSKTFRLGRKNTPEPERKFELDLANALPSSDDFRTSLLMSGLSARFSMLREQDDPNSKIGKASDDSVLYPKRQSRLADFGFQSHGLHDIAEVSSIRTSIRPPFASNRVDSYHSVDSSGDDGGSMMGRSKPGEGNNLFGGRQKIYKIPTGGLRLNGEPGTMGGRALYEDDVSQSAFQKLREREREQKRREELEELEREDEADASFPLRSNSPPLLGYNRNRETSSTTSSGPSLTRSSTAATSVTSQRAPSVKGSSSPSTPAIPNQPNGVDRSMTKGKRLYETGLDQHLHSQQHSAISRIDTLSRQHNFGFRTPSPSFGSSTINSYDHIHASGLNTHHVTIRSPSPPPSSTALNSFDFGVKASIQEEIRKPVFTAAPLSPPMSDTEESSTLPIQPNDLGKATATGAFMKPVQPYDEKKYTQRQLQMQQGRETPPLRRNSPPEAFHPPQPYAGRSRAESNATYSSGRSRSSSSAQRHYMPQGRNMGNYVPRSEMSTPDLYEEPPQPYIRSANGSSADSLHDKTFDREIIRVHPGTPRLNGKLSSRQIITERPPESQHPANRPRNQQPRMNPAASTNGAASPSISISNATETVEKAAAQEPATDSPTLGPGNGLSGLVRQHLRHDSNTSSVYGAPSPGIVSAFPTSTPEPTLDTYNSKGNPWDSNDWDQNTDDHTNGTGPTPDAPLSFQTRPAPLSLGYPRKADQSHRIDGTHESSWEGELVPNHTRSGSSETQKERVEFANELASARKRVQANLKSFVESDSRSSSPTPRMESERDVGLAKSSSSTMLKSKSSRDSIIAKSRSGQSKAMKMLGIGSVTMASASSPGKQKFDENLWKQEEEEMLRGVVKAPRNPPPTKAFRQARRDAQRDRERQVLMRHQQVVAGSSGDSDEVGPASPTGQSWQQQAHREREPATFGARAPSQESKSSSAGSNRTASRPPSRSTRDRSTSDTSRSKSRGRYRDDLAKAMAEGRGTSAQGVIEEDSPPRPQVRNGTYAPSPIIPSPVVPSPVIPSPAMTPSGRSRSGSRTTAMGYFDSYQLQPIQIGRQEDIGVSPRPSPVTPYAVNPTPALGYPSPSPMSSAVNTPTSQVFQSQGRIPVSLKRPINKHDISEPKLISKTSRMTTINLPEGASLQNGMASAPPLPPQDPRRRQTRTQTMFGTLMGKGTEPPPTPPPVLVQSYEEEMSTFSADEAEYKPKLRQRLRKSSSEGGNLNMRARQAFNATPSPAVPTFPVVKSNEGGMF